MFCAASAHAANLVTDGGFESPVVPAGGFECCPIFYTVGQTFGPGWTVVGSASGNIALSNNTEFLVNSSPFFYLTTEEGSQSVDLTGGTDNGSPTGVEQVIATTAGTTYAVTFYVGSINNAGYSASGNASVILKINGTAVLTATNSNSSGTVPNWQLFTYNFTAAGASTTLDFINNTAAGAGLAGLDNVQVNATSSPAPSTTPAPPGIVLALAGLMCLGLYWGWRNRALSWSAWRD